MTLRPDIEGLQAPLLQTKEDEEPLFAIGDRVESNSGTDTGIIGTIAGIRNIRQVEGPDEITYLIMYDGGGDDEKAWWPELTLTLVPPATEQKEEIPNG